MSLDMRLIDPGYEDHPGNKASLCAEKIAAYYHRYDFVKGTQFVFSDIGTYKPGEWNIYSEIRRKLVEDHGLPEDEIKFIHEAKTASDRKGFFKAMNEGKIRVLFGSTSKLGTGVNAQQRVVAIHHLDSPWRPSDLEQRNGRGIRSGNEVAKLHADNKVEVFIYAVERSLDSYKFNLLANKQLFINQMKTNSLGNRRLDEGALDDETGMNFAEYVAVLSGNTDLLDKARLDKKIAALESERKNFYYERDMNKARYASLLCKVENLELRLKHIGKDKETWLNLQPSPENPVVLPIHLEGMDGVTDVKALAERLHAYQRNAKTSGNYLPIGKIGNFPIVVKSEGAFSAGSIAFTDNRFFVEGSGRQVYYTHNNGNLAKDPILAVESFSKALLKISSIEESCLVELDAAKRNLEIYKELSEKVWTKHDELSHLQKEVSVLNRRINSEISQIKEDDPVEEIMEENASLKQMIQNWKEAGEGQITIVPLNKENCFQIYGDDALQVSPVLDLQVRYITENGEKIPFVSFPEASLEKYLSILVSNKIKSKVVSFPDDRKIQIRPQKGYSHGL